MNTDFDMWGLAIAVILLLIAIGIIIGYAINSIDTQKMGNLICEQNDLGEYDYFDSKNKIIYCNPNINENTINGYIKVIGD